MFPKYSGKAYVNCAVKLIDSYVNAVVQPQIKLI